MIIGIVAGGGQPLAPPPPDPWTPADITTALWLDAADSATVTIDSGAVSQWADKSGNGRHASQGTSANRPTYPSGVLNGLPVVRFDGTNDVLQLASQITATALTAFVAINKSAASSGFRTVLRLDRHQLLSRMTTNGDQWGVWMQTEVTSGVQLTSSYRVLSVVQRASNDVDLVTDGTLVNRTNGTGLPNTSATGFVGASSATLQQHPGDLAEIVVVAAAMSVGDRQIVEGYLAHKWGLAGSLPIDHPYKDHPPVITP